jgi:hypothetical protein
VTVVLKSLSLSCGFGFLAAFRVQTGRGLFLFAVPGGQSAPGPCRVLVPIPGSVAVLAGCRMWFPALESVALRTTRRWRGVGW